MHVVVSKYAQRYTAHKWQSRNMNTASLVPGSGFLITVLYQLSLCCEHLPVSEISQ